MEDVLLEVQAISPEEEKKRSWFVAQEIVSGPSFAIASYVVDCV